MANVHTPAILTPTQVTKMQAQLSEHIGISTELIMHCIISNNVSALGSVKNVIATKLDGTFVQSSKNDTLNDIAAAEQIIRDHFATDQALDLVRVELLIVSQRKIMLAHVLGVRQLTSKEIGALETRIREATGEDTIELAFSSFQKTLKNTEGTIRYGWILGNQGTPEIRERIRQIRADLFAAFNREDAYELVDINATSLDGKLHFLLEIVGPEVFPHQKVANLQAQLSQRFQEPIALYAWSRVEMVYDPKGPISLGKLREYFSDRQKENLPEEIPLMLETLNR